MRPQRICSQSNHNCNIPSSEPHGRSNKLLTQMCSIGEDKALDLKIEKGECCMVFSSPESLLGNGRWRSILSSDFYKNNLIGIIVDEALAIIIHW